MGLIKDGPGRIPKYTKKTFAEKVDAFIEQKEFGGGDGKGKGPVTVLGFCKYAGIYKDYISEHNLKNKSVNDFSEAIKKLKTIAEHDLEYYMLTGRMNATGAIFCLKNNYGWKDKNETELSGGFTLTSSLTSTQRIEQKKEIPD